MIDTKHKGPEPVTYIKEGSTTLIHDINELNQYPDFISSTHYLSIHYTPDAPDLVEVTLLPICKKKMFIGRGVVGNVVTLPTIKFTKDCCDMCNELLKKCGFDMKLVPKEEDQ